MASAGQAAPVMSLLPRLSNVGYSSQPTCARTLAPRKFCVRRDATRHSPPRKRAPAPRATVSKGPQVAAPEVPETLSTSKLHATVSLTTDSVPTEPIRSCCQSPAASGDESAEATTSPRNQDDAKLDLIWMASIGAGILGVILLSTQLGFDIEEAAEGFSELLYTLGYEANRLVQAQAASGLTLGSAGVVFGAGLVTSFSPCTLGVLPLTIGYIGGYETSKSRLNVAIDAGFFSFGLATSLALLGVVASVAGLAYGQIGQGLPVAVSCVAILMGLNLLHIVPLRLPSISGLFNPRGNGNMPSGLQAYLAGMTFALAASPCSTPVLATLLTYVATAQDPLLGGALLLTYTMGYVSPLLVAASFTGALKSILSMRQYSTWISPASGALLLGGGVYSLLTKLFPGGSMMS